MNRSRGRNQHFERRPAGVELDFLAAALRALRSVPHRGHIPRQSARHSGNNGNAAKSESRTISRRLRWSSAHLVTALVFPAATAEQLPDLSRDRPVHTGQAAPALPFPHRGNRPRDSHPSIEGLADDVRDRLQPPPAHGCRPPPLAARSERCCEPRLACTRAGLASPQCHVEGVHRHCTGAGPSSTHAVLVEELLSPASRGLTHS